MKKVLMIIAGIMVMAASCQKRDDVVVSQDFAFDVRATEVGPNYAEIEIRHNGSNRDTYYGFVVEGSVRNLRQTVDSFVQETTLGVILSESFSQKKRVLMVTSLMPDRNYTYLVFGIDDEGNVMESIDSCCIRTTHGIDNFVVNENIKITNLGEKLVDNDYKTVVQVDVDESEPDFNLMCFFKENQYEDIRSMIYSESSEVIEYLSENYGSKITDHNMVTRSSCVVYSWKEPGYYYVATIGMDENGNLTGRYAISEKFEVTQYTMFEEFAALLGTWEVKDGSGKTFTVEIENEMTNHYINIKKWGGLKYTVWAKYDNTSKCAIMYYSLVEGDVKFNNGKVGDIVLNVWYHTSDGGKFRATNYGELAKVKCSSGSTSGTIKPYYKYSDNETEKGLYYEIHFDDGERSTYTNSTFKFPFTMTKQ